MASRVTLERIRRWARELKTHLATLWFSRSHPDTPIAAKLMAGLVVAYAFSPIDLIPDFIPILGYLDDLVLVPLGIYLTLRLLPAHVIAESRVKTDAWLAAEKVRPSSYIAAGLIVFTWAVLAWWAWTAFAG